MSKYPAEWMENPAKALSAIPHAGSNTVLQDSHYRLVYYYVTTPKQLHFLIDYYNSIEDDAACGVQPEDYTLPGLVGFVTFGDYANAAPPLSFYKKEWNDLTRRVSALALQQAASPQPTPAEPPESYHLFWLDDAPHLFAEDSPAFPEDIKDFIKDSDYLGSFTFTEAFSHVCEKPSDEPWPVWHQDEITNPMLHCLPDVPYAVCSYVLENGADYSHRLEYNVTAEEFRRGIRLNKYREGAALCPMQQVGWRTLSNGQPAFTKIRLTLGELYALWPYWQKATITIAPSWDKTNPGSDTYTIDHTSPYFAPEKQGHALYAEIDAGGGRLYTELTNHIDELDATVLYCAITEYKKLEEPNHEQQ